ncbi:MAG: hypothetical protein QNI87_12945 [Erythrobacter sp.]|uniref:beta strand repeat-containing protein n=1 Tax=Erythrobacter sp. TaxID=1042 RepID=UPI0026117E88|nr:hypothetical protein [Erythrobacter sp.]MDJ0979426.1 hypothetical protein [Erythrobacter sp.]
MKTSVLLSASALALAMGSPAFAQANQSQIDQTGTANDALVTQAGVENVSDVEQDGENNTAIVTQRDLEPGTVGFSTPANASDVQQFGQGGYALVDQTTREAGGPGNSAKITQYGVDGAAGSGAQATPAIVPVADFVPGSDPANNLAIIVQSAGTAGGPNTATITQGAPGDPVYGNGAYIDQFGDGNASEINQQALGAGAINIQSGQNNTSFITQNDGTLTQSIGGGLDAPFDPEATVTQVGNFNTSFVNQDANPNGGSRNLVVDVLQTGDDNMSSIDQNANGPGFTGTYRANVIQTGSSTSDVVQTGDGQGIRNFRATVTSDDSSSVINQIGNGSNSGDLDATLVQTGGSTSLINQTVDTTTPGGTPQAGFIDADVTQANGATARINQTVLGDSSGGQEAIVNQNGMSTVEIDQTFIDRTGPDFSRDFVADVTQSGTDNLTSILQQDQGAANINTNGTPDLSDDVGDANVSATVLQSGNSNDIFVSQFNRNQAVDITQSGDANLIDALQDGVGNALTVTSQSGNDNSIFSIQNGGGTGTVTQGGSNNTTNLTQTGSSNQRAVIDQLGTMNTANVLQQGTARQEDAFITQLADLSNSTASITQNGAADGLRSDNLASIVQGGGDNNTSTIVQTGRENVALSEQMGSDLFSSIMQTGFNNTALVGQAGNGHSSTITQTGNGNTASVSQGGAALPTAP